MRYLIFGDVHGSLPALEKMLEHEKGNFDALICHGDVVNYGPWSNECVDLLDALKVNCLMGNHEEYFIHGEYPGQNLVAKTFFNYCYPSFTKKALIEKYRKGTELLNYCVQHSINGQYFFPDTDFSSILINNNYIFGHSHYQFYKKVNNYELYNTGSVGQNRKFINQICYLLFDSELHQIELKALEYDVDIVINEMKSRNYPQVCLDYYLLKKRVSLTTINK